MDVGDDEKGGTWMTYRELATARRVKLAAAVRLVQRHKWRRQTGNDGTARIMVPSNWAKPSDRVLPDIAHDVDPDVVHDTDDDVADDVTPDRHILAGALAALEDAVSALRERAEGAERRAEAAEARTSQALTLLADVESVLIKERDRSDRTEAASAGERQRADVLRERLDSAERDLAVAQHDAQTALQATAALRQAEEARKARGRLRRAWDGWRGR